MPPDTERLILPFPPLQGGLETEVEVVSGAGCVTTALNVPEQFGDVLEMVTEYVPAESPVMLVAVPLTGPPAGLVRDHVQL